MLLLSRIGKKYKKIIFSKKDAFTLIELVITLGVFTIGILGAFSLALANSNENRINKDRLTAVNLAREGLELVRNIRDSNWLAADSNVMVGSVITPWHRGVNSNSFILVDYDENSSGTEICSGQSPENISDCFNQCKGASECPIYIDQEGFYTNENTTNGNPNVRTNFNRIISLRKICIDNDGDEEIVESCTSGKELVGFLVTSIVDWNRAGKEYTLQLEDRLYNWRR